MSLKPSSIVRLPPSKDNLFRNVGEVTKIYPAFRGLVFVTDKLV